MHYDWDITIPANTLESQPYKEELKLDYGVLKQVDIKFPAGCHGMVKVRLKRWGFQLVPLSSDEWVTGDDETVPTERQYKLLEVPIFLTLEACSPDTIYDHTISVHITIEDEVSSELQEVINRLDKVIELLGGENA